MLCERFDEENLYLDYRAGVIASTIANVHRSKESNPFTPQMFMPNYEGDTAKEQPEEQILNTLLALYPRRPAEDHGQ